MMCSICDGTGWVCENHPDRPSDCGGSKRANVCKCGAGMPCVCNPCGGIDEPPDYSRVIEVPGIGHFPKPLVPFEFPGGSFAITERKRTILN
jgi:hypothetical protein